MKHLIICREYPPAPGGGIGTYVHHMSRLLAQSGETVHVIGQMWDKAEKTVEEQCGGKLILHRVPFEDWKIFFRRRPSSMVRSKIARALYASEFPAQCFSWLAGALAERLVKEEGIDAVETQDYEAPLYYFQVRRALGLGPKRRPPCFVHLHSPTEFVVPHNDWNIAPARWLAAKRVEDYTISAADALLCPSRFLAGQAEAHYGLSMHSIKVIPYPMGDSAILKRDHETWSSGSICYLGRLEKRKGVLEWIEAAVSAVKQYPNARFEFIGANVLGPNLVFGEALLNRLIPRDLRKRFVFHGEVSRSAIPSLLERARIAVVPSRWENFPNTCMEAMGSGLPVIASPAGGMAEMVMDGQSGWIAENAEMRGLQDALRRALQTPPVRIAEMGKAAAKRIRQICDNQKIVEKHLSFRRCLVDRPSVRCSALPANPPQCKRPAVKKKGRAAVTIPDVSADYGSNGFVPGADDSTHEVTDPDLLERFRELVAQDIERISAPPPAYPDAVSGSESTGRLGEQLAMIRCLLGNPSIGLRVFQQIAAKIARR